ncbi:hypothetical protein CAAN3_07S05292 [[Candida] anglica]
MYASLIRPVRSKLLCKTSLRNLCNTITLKEKEKLYFGRFTQQEYDEAAAIVKQQVENLEKQIKGPNDPRSKVGTMPSIPAAPTVSKDKNNTSSKISITSLADILVQSIKTTGPISLSAYMRQCLTHPEFGYYTTRDPLDSKSGDFITSPEISSVFGEMIGVWLFSTWLQQGSPKKVRIIEFGPGKGTLMHDVIKCFNRLSKGAAAMGRGSDKTTISIIMIEASPVLREEQRKLLCKENPLLPGNKCTTQWGNTIEWVDTEKDIVEDSNMANYILAHEFFDALPIKSFEKGEKNTWRELLVEHSSSVNNTQGKLEGTSKVDSKDTSLLETDFHLTLAPKETPSSYIPKNTRRFHDLPVGTRVEICPDAQLYISKMADLVKDKTGAVLVMDYGISEGVPDNTLRGIYKHKFVSPFYSPGDVDLSIDVDFENLKILGEGNGERKVFGPVEQGDWLHEMGVGYRIDQLLKKNKDSPAEQDKIYDSYLRLTGKDDKGMGKVYKFLTILPSGTKESPGFMGL